ncbi:retropepsin-like aspartic protease [Chondromyces apiculatus]|uniref:Peptidase A2 domain-containing protein n=1 Tax=Chondromyces apiculatus DSM 436 TaxID=1192034 RepID=A0A017SWI6_9BACT|nr:retropepsin-like aspartic protease [Chondromyces apiculatus]EYF01102.1 Hypothetical protein CAP_8607 [Chondromyces apiculatus DSM 436]
MAQARGAEAGASTRAAGNPGTASRATGAGASGVAGVAGVAGAAGAAGAAGVAGAQAEVAPEGAGATAAPGAAEATTARRTTLRFSLGERDFPAPLVDAVVGGQPTTLIVDTGATHHVIARWVAEELALPVASGGDVGVDHAGQAVRVGRVSGVKLSLSGWGAVEAPHLLVVEVPEALARAGIGGVIAPQALASAGRAVVLDLGGRVLSEVQLSEAFAAEPAGAGGAGAASRGDTPLELTLCGAVQEGQQVLARAEIEGVPITLKMDSGATQTSIWAGSGAGKRLAGKAKGVRSAYAASGKHTVPVLRGVRVQLGGKEIESDIDLIPGMPRAVCPADGFAGMDLIAGCALVFGGGRALARCGRAAPR